MRIKNLQNPMMMKNRMADHLKDYRGGDAIMYRLPNAESWNKAIVMDKEQAAFMLQVTGISKKGGLVFEVNTGKFKLLNAEMQYEITGTTW